MDESRAQLSLRKFDRALLRLAEALDEPREAPLALDGTIQRFEFVFELAWKTFKHVLELEGLQAATPREALRGAFSAGYIESEEVWLALLQARNETSHTYDDEVAQRVYGVIEGAFPALAAAATVLREKLTAIEGAR